MLSHNQIPNQSVYMSLLYFSPLLSISGELFKIFGGYLLSYHPYCMIMIILLIVILTLTYCKCNHHM